MTSSTQKRRATFLGAAAVAALIAGGAIETGLVAPSTAHAEAPLDAQPLAMPSFADVIDRVKPAVVSVRVKMQQVADRTRAATTRTATATPVVQLPECAAGQPARPFLPRLPAASSARRAATTVSRAARSPGAGLRLLHLRRRLPRDQQPRRRERRRGAGRAGRRLDPRRQGDRHRSEDRPRPAQGRGQRLPLREASPPRRPRSATGCSRSAIRSASAERSRPASSRPSTATSARGPMTTSSRSMRR